MRFAVVVVGYNRIEGIIRLIYSLNVVDYFGDRVDLIISLDKSDMEGKIVLAVTQIEWPFGEIKIRTFPERQGLRRHVLSCGEFLSDYDAIAVLEDDLLVSPSLYSYARACYEKYADNENIAGVSLYKHLYNQNSSRPFEPESTQYDAYFMQYAASWGQIWFRKQWQAFQEWYGEHAATFGLTEGVPDHICRWPNSSWLKYHIRYCIETNKYFVYPYQSISTCFSEKGEHTGRKLTKYQVPVISDIKAEFALPDYEKAIKYDAYFERVFDGVSICGISSNDICMDIYGQKHSFDGKRYVVSTQALPYKVIDSFSLDMRPHENNILYGIKGRDFFLYDSLVNCKAPKRNREAIFRYYFRLDGNSLDVLYSAVHRADVLYNVINHIKCSIFKQRRQKSNNDLQK